MAGAAGAGFGGRPLPAVAARAAPAAGAAGAGCASAAGLGAASAGAGVAGPVSGVGGAADGVSGPKSGAGLGGAWGCRWVRYHHALTAPAAKASMASRRTTIGRAEPASERRWDGEVVGMGTPRGGSAPENRADSRGGPRARSTNRAALHDAATLRYRGEVPSAFHFSGSR